MRGYLDAYVADKEGLQGLMDAEVLRIEEEMKTAITEAKTLVKRMQNFLGGNQDKLKQFLEEQKHAVEVLSKPKM